MPSIRVALQFRPTASGGRATPVNLTTGSYRPHFVTGSRQLLGVAFVQAIQPVVQAGDATIATAALMYPHVDYSSLVPGATFDVVEGTRVVATGRVLAPE